MSKGKTSADDLVVMEMIVELDDRVLVKLAECFKLRAINHEAEDVDESWDEYLVYLIIARDVETYSYFSCHLKIVFCSTSSYCERCDSANFRILI